MKIARLLAPLREVLSSDKYRRHLTPWQRLVMTALVMLFVGLSQVQNSIYPFWG